MKKIALYFVLFLPSACFLQASVQNQSKPTYEIIESESLITEITLSWGTNKANLSELKLSKEAPMLLVANTFYYLDNQNQSLHQVNLDVLNPYIDEETKNIRQDLYKDGFTVLDEQTKFWSGEGMRVGMALIPYTKDGKEVGVVLLTRESSNGLLYASIYVNNTEALSKQSPSIIKLPSINQPSSSGGNSDSKEKDGAGNRSNKETSSFNPDCSVSIGNYKTLACGDSHFFVWATGYGQGLFCQIDGQKKEVIPVKAIELPQKTTKVSYDHTLGSLVCQDNSNTSLKQIQVIKLPEKIKTEIKNLSNIIGNISNLIGNTKKLLTTIEDLGKEREKQKFIIFWTYLTPLVTIGCCAFLYFVWLRLYHFKVKPPMPIQFPQPLNQTAQQFNVSISNNATIAQTLLKMHKVS